MDRASEKKDLRDDRSKSGAHIYRPRNQRGIRQNSDLIMAIGLAALNVVWTQVFPSLPVGIFFALPLIFFLPGYTLSQVLIHKLSAVQALDASTTMLQAGLNEERTAGGVDQIVLSLGLSLTIDVLVGFTLNMFPMGLQAVSWALSLGLFTMVCALLAAFLRRGEIRRATHIFRPGITISDGILYGLAILIVSLATWFAIIRPLEPQPSFTQFWMLPEHQADKSCAVSLGVRNFESTPVIYRVVVTSNGFELGTWPSITLAPQGAWIQSVTVVPGSASSIFIEARLYREDQPGRIYRNVHLTFHIAVSTNNGQIQLQCVL